MCLTWASLVSLPSPLRRSCHWPDKSMPSWVGPQRGQSCQRSLTRETGLRIVEWFTFYFSQIPSCDSRDRLVAPMTALETISPESCERLKILGCRAIQETFSPGRRARRSLATDDDDGDDDDDRDRSPTDRHAADDDLRARAPRRLTTIDDDRLSPLLPTPPSDSESPSQTVPHPQAS